MEEDRIQSKEIKEEPLAMEMLKEINRHNKRLIAALFTILVLWAATIAGFLIYMNQYEFQSYSQDGEGYNNINTGRQGDVINGTEIPSTEEEEW